MNENLDLVGYYSTKEKLAEMQRRLDRLEQRTIENVRHRDESRRSYEEMIRQYRREIKLFEASHPEVTVTQ